MCGILIKLKPSKKPHIQECVSLQRSFRVRVCCYDFDQNLYSRVPVAIFCLLPGWPFEFACYATLVSSNENIFSQIILHKSFDVPKESCIFEMDISLLWWRRDSYQDNFISPSRLCINIILKDLRLMIYAAIRPKGTTFAKIHL